MWHRINDSKVIVKTVEHNRILLRVYECGELKEIKTFKTEVQATTYITLQKSLNETVECEKEFGLRIKNKKEG